MKTGNSGSLAHGVEVLSLLDSVVGPLRQRPEKTYSAPLATHLYAKETSEIEGGRQGRSFPRLVYGGAHLKDPERDKIADIVFEGHRGSNSWQSYAVECGWKCPWSRGPGQTPQGSFLVWVLIVFRGQSEIPWNAAWFTGLALLMLGVPAVVLSAKYHVLGTDKVGQDVLYLSIKSVRTGLVIGALTTLVMLPFASYSEPWPDFSGAGSMT